MHTSDLLLPYDTRYDDTLTSIVIAIVAHMSIARVLSSTGGGARKYVYDHDCSNLLEEKLIQMLMPSRAARSSLAAVKATAGTAAPRQKILKM